MKKYLKLIILLIAISPISVKAAVSICNVNFTITNYAGDGTITYLETGEEFSKSKTITETCGKNMNFNVEPVSNALLASIKSDNSNVIINNHKITINNIDTDTNIEIIFVTRGTVVETKEPTKATETQTKATETPTQYVYQTETKEATKTTEITEEIKTTETTKKKKTISSNTIKKTYLIEGSILLICIIIIIIILILKKINKKK